MFSTRLCKCTLVEDMTDLTMLETKGLMLIKTSAGVHPEHPEIGLQ